MKQYEYFVSLVVYADQGANFKDISIVMDEPIQSSDGIKELKKKLKFKFLTILNFQLLREFESKEEGGG